MDQYTFISARTELINRLGGRNDPTTIARATEWLNSAQLHFAKSYIELPRLHQVNTIEVVADQSEYSLLNLSQDLTNLVGIRSIRNEGLTSGADPTFAIRMYRFPWGEYRSLSMQARSRPVRWARHGTLLAVDPKPDNNYTLTIDYRRRPQFETVELDSEWHDHWINCAVYIGWGALDQYNLAQSAFAMLPQWLQQQIQTPIQEEEWEQYWDKSGLKASSGGFHP